MARFLFYAFVFYAFLSIWFFSAYCLGYHAGKRVGAVFVPQGSVTP